MSPARRANLRPGAPRSRALTIGLVAVGFAIVAVAGLVWRSKVRLPPALDTPPALSQTGTESAVGGVGGKTPLRTGAVSEQAAALVTQGNDLLRQGQFEAAAKVYEDAKRLTPEDEDVHYNLGIAFARLGREDEAVAAYRRALELFPQYAEAHNNLGILLHRRGDLDAAFEHFRAAIQAVPDYASAHNNLGNALRQRGLAAEAAAAFLKAAQIDTNYWQARFNLANSYASQNRWSDAIAEYEAVLRLQPEFGPAQQALDQARLKQSSSAP